MRSTSREQAKGNGSPTLPSLEELMELFLNGDHRAFEQLYERLSPRVVSLLHVLGGDRRLAEDLAQTTFLKVHRARSTFTRGARVEPWVFAIARRTLLDHRRSRRRRPEDLSADGSLPEPEQTTHVDGDSRLAPEQERVLYSTLAALPENQREAVVLLKVQGLTVSEAAKVAGTTPGAIKLRAHRAYEALRAALGLKHTEAKS